MYYTWLTHVVWNCFRWLFLKTLFDLQLGIEKRQYLQQLNITFSPMFSHHAVMPIPFDQQTILKFLTSVDYLYVQQWRLAALYSVVFCCSIWKVKKPCPSPYLHLQFIHKLPKMVPSLANRFILWTAGINCMDDRRNCTYEHWLPFIHWHGRFFVCFMRHVFIMLCTKKYPDFHFVGDWIMKSFQSFILGMKLWWLKNWIYRVGSETFLFSP